VGEREWWGPDNGGPGEVGLALANIDSAKAPGGEGSIKGKGKRGELNKNQNQNEVSP